MEIGGQVCDLFDKEAMKPSLFHDPILIILRLTIAQRVSATKMHGYIALT